MRTSWNQFHPDPRMSYYLSLRRDYRCPAKQALAQVRQADAMILGIQREGLEAGTLVSATAFNAMVLGLRSALRSIRVWLQHQNHEGWSRRRDDVLMG